MILEATDFESVRKSLDTRLDATLIPPELIALPIYAGTAEAEVKRRDPHALDYRTGGAAPDSAKWQAVRNACAFITAALIAPSVPQITSERTPDNMAVQFAKVDWQARAQELLGRAAAEMASYLNDSGYAAPLPVAVPCKGRPEPPLPWRWRPRVETWP